MSRCKLKKMKISIKNSTEIEKMRVAGKLAAEVLEIITPFVNPGISTGELDKICFNHIFLVNLDLSKSHRRISMNMFH